MAMVFYALRSGLILSSQCRRWSTSNKVPVGVFKAFWKVSQCKLNVVVGSNAAYLSSFRLPFVGYCSNNDKILRLGGITQSAMCGLHVRMA